MTQEINVTLNSDIVYVYGSVNDEIVNWQKQGDSWKTVVPRAQSSIYNIEITAWDEAGNSTMYKVTMRYGLNLIFSRTQEDVNYVKALNTKIAANGFQSLTAKEREDWIAGLKGAYNAIDLNRVDYAVQFISDLLYEYGYIVEVILPPEDWRVEDIPVARDMNEYLDNIKKLIDKFAVMSSTPSPPESMNNLTYEGANAIERILFDIYYLIQNMVADFIYSDEIYSGEDDFI